MKVTAGSSSYRPENVALLTSQRPKEQWLSDKVKGRVFTAFVLTSFIALIFINAFVFKNQTPRFVYIPVIIKVR